jgi:hypothetical protein
MKLYEYIDEHLKIDSSKTKIDQPYGRYRGYRKGVLYYHRKDGTPVTQEDIDVLDKYKRGQGHGVRGKAGDMEVSVHYTCDSGD